MKNAPQVCCLSTAWGAYCRYFIKLARLKLLLHLKQERLLIFNLSKWALSPNHREIQT